MTGDVSDAHDIIAVTTYSAIMAKDPVHDKTNQKKGFFSRKPKAASADGQAQEGLSIFLKLFIFAGLCGGGFYGYREYQRRQRYGGGNFGLGSNNGGFGGGGMYSGNKRNY